MSDVGSNGAGPWDAWVAQQIGAVRAAGQWREPRVLDGRGPCFRLADGREVVSFASNDYLGLAGNPTVVAAAHAALDEWGAGSGAARLIVGSRPVHHDLESELAAWKRSDAAVLFPTGFAANLGVLTTLAGPSVTVVSDELNHASIIDGCRLARANVVVSRHNDAACVDAILAACPGRALVVTDLVFSMDGDVAPLAELGEVCASHGALLVLDEAHLVVDPSGGCREPDEIIGGRLGGIDAKSVVRVGTLSKTLGSLGGFAA
ncbi:MAG: 8-amino-7-oxononanoate synthase, partial [Acidimicrobiaceae bacterium]|nr:8-amino-7-oxononanoate synthase [Acidimicrobiaceae bacterium]